MGLSRMAMQPASVLFFAALIYARSVIESSSFGNGDRISPNGWEVPGWHVSGEGQVPELLSDKIILTPSYPGNVRGAVWSEAKVEPNYWAAELEFRASGPDRGSGNLQIWYAKDGHTSVGTSSLYTVEKFDGMALVIDQYGGKGGSIRGFMNDGNIDFKHHYAIDSLAFGHCDFSFRNLGRPVKLQIRQEPEAFEVIIDGRLCFSSDKIRMPSGYNFGITAASAETPDSFEAYRFQLWSSRSSTRDEPQGARTSSFEASRDTSTPIYKSSDSQFADLQSRIQLLAQAIQKLEHEISNIHRSAEVRHQEVIRGLLTRETLNDIASQGAKLDRIERLTNTFHSQFSNIHSTLKESHESLTEGLPKHIGNLITNNAPRMGMLIFLFVVIQVLSYGIYTAYNRRSKQGPKKYL